jgi:hypothetical protein
MTRRIKQSATVDPARLEGALREKLGAAQWKLHELREAEQPRFTPNLEPQTLIAHFLLSARGVHATAKTFAEASWLKGDFAAWRTRWEDSLSPPDVALWDNMQDERDAADHGDGAGLIPIRIPLPRQDCHLQNSTQLLMGLPGYKTDSFKGGMRFEAYPNEPASAVCFKYLELCRRFDADFLQENALRTGGPLPQPAAASPASIDVPVRADNVPQSPA